MSSRTLGSLSPRLQAKVDVTDDCWLWTGTTDIGGYGRIWIPELHATQPAHRVVYEYLVGPVPTDLVLDHLCRVRHCVRPDHLEPVTQRENILRGDLPDLNKAKGAAVTHCKRGHEYTAENTYIHHGRRTCRTCGRAGNKRPRYPGGRDRVLASP